MYLKSLSCLLIHYHLYNKLSVGGNGTALCDVSLQLVSLRPLIRLNHFLNTFLTLATHGNLIII